MDEHTSESDEIVGSLSWLVMMSAVREEVREMDLPHLVVCYDPETDVTSYQGPFGTGLEALTYAEAEARRCRASDELTGLRYWAAPMQQPMQAG